MTARKKQTSESEQLAPVNVVYGKDRRRAVDQLHKLIDQALDGADPQVALGQYEGDDVELADVLDELKTLPFLSPCRVVVVKDADSFISSYRGELEAYCENPSATGILILLADSFPGNTRLAKKVAAKGKIIDCSPVKAAQLGGFVRDYVRGEYGMAISDDAVDMLIELAGDDSGLLLSEVDKIATFLEGDSGQKRIELNHITALVGHNRKFDVFNVIDAMITGNTALSLDRLDRMLRQDRDAEFKSVGAFAWHFRRLYNACLMSKKRVPDFEICRELKVWPKAVHRQFLQQSRRMGVSGASLALRKLMDLDLASKTGRGTVKSGLEKFIVEMAAVGK